jgi:hypothetical protein
MKGKGDKTVSDSTPKRRANKGKRSEKEGRGVY